MTARVVCANVPYFLDALHNNNNNNNISVSDNIITDTFKLITKTSSPPLLYYYYHYHHHHHHHCIRLSLCGKYECDEVWSWSRGHWLKQTGHCIYIKVFLIKYVLWWSCCYRIWVWLGWHRRCLLFSVWTSSAAQAEAAAFRQQSPWTEQYNNDIVSQSRCNQHLCSCQGTYCLLIICRNLAVQDTI